MTQHSLKLRGPACGRAGVTSGHTLNTCGTTRSRVGITSGQASSLTLMPQPFRQTTKQPFRRGKATDREPKLFFLFDKNAKKIQHQTRDAARDALGGRARKKEDLGTAGCNTRSWGPRPLIELPCHVRDHQISPWLGRFLSSSWKKKVTVRICGQGLLRL